MTGLKDLSANACLEDDATQEGVNMERTCLTRVLDCGRS